MKIDFRAIQYCLFFLVSTSLTSCELFDNEPAPREISEISFISYNSAIIETIGSTYDVSNWGICWAKNSYPTIKDFKIENPLTCENRDFQFHKLLTVTDLTPNTKYYMRIFWKSKNANILYGETKTFNTEEIEENNIQYNQNLSYESISDIDGNVYKTIKIGSQIWMAENLRTTRFRNAEVVLNGIGNDPFCSHYDSTYDNFSYEYDYHNALKFGKFYDSESVNSTAGLAPIGWHVATISDWQELQEYLISNKFNFDNTDSENKIAKSLSSQTDWKSSLITGSVGNNLLNNNSSGFTALPSGDGYLYSIKPSVSAFRLVNENSFKKCFFWGISNDKSQIVSWDLNSTGIETHYKNYFKGSFLNVRCVKDK